MGVGFHFLFFLGDLTWNDPILGWDVPVLSKVFGFAWACANVSVEEG